jgi:hypothetical protein
MRRCFAVLAAPATGIDGPSADLMRLKPFVGSCQGGSGERPELRVPTRNSMRPQTPWVLLQRGMMVVRAPSSIIIQRRPLLSSK